MSAESRRQRADAARKRDRRAQLLPVLVVLGGVVIAGAIIAAVVAGGGDDEPPVPGSPEELALGEEVFVANCQTCHGEAARGGLAGPPLTHEIYQDLRDQDIRAAIANGVPQKNWEFAPMEPVPGLDDSEVAAVIRYVRSQQEQVWGDDEADSGS